MNKLGGQALVIVLGKMMGSEVGSMRYSTDVFSGWNDYGKTEEP